MLTLTVPRALFASCAVACIGGALLLPSLAGGRGLAGVGGTPLRGTPLRRQSDPRKSSRRTEAFLREAPLACGPAVH